MTNVLLEKKGPYAVATIHRPEALNALNSQVLADLAELRQAASLIMLDVDLFKIYNDTLGHQEGDACLRRVAQAMRDGLRGGDHELFRYGGEEFAGGLDGVSPEHALQVAERLRQTVEQLGIPHPGSPAGHVTLSLGVAAVEVLTPETLPGSWRPPTAPCTAPRNTAATGSTLPGSS